MRDKLKRWMRDLDLNAEDGFTLIELMVVVMIMGVLLAMATTTFIGAKDRATNGSARAAAAQTLTTARVVYTDHALYTDATAANLLTAEPGFQFVQAPTASTDTKHPSVSSPDVNTFVATVYAPTGYCFYIRDRVFIGIDFAKVASTQANCYATNVGGVTFSKVW